MIRSRSIAQPAGGGNGQRTFAIKGAELNHKYLERLERRQRPWHAPYGAWQRIGSTIEGMTEKNGYCIAVLKEPKNGLTATISPRDPGARGGFVVNFASDLDFTYVLIDSNGDVSAYDVRGGVRKPRFTTSNDIERRSDASLTVALSVEGVNWVLMLDGHCPQINSN